MCKNQVGGFILTSRTLSKEKIIETAIELINQQETLTFTNLSKKLGTRSQAIYNYYSDVMDIKNAVVVYFFDQLATRLNADLLGLSGKQAIKAFANVSTQYALENFLIAQQILSIPVEQKREGTLEESIESVYKILKLFLNQIIEDEQQRIIIARMLRNLIIGEVVHVGNGRFNNKKISSRDSFDQMLEITLLEV